MLSDYERQKLRELLDGQGALSIGAVMKEKVKAKRYWMGDVGQYDDFGRVIEDEFIDGVTFGGPWAIMTPQSWRMNGQGTKLGTGLGQRYQKQADGKWLKVEG